MANVLFGSPIQSDINSTYTPTFDSTVGVWSGALPLVNLQDRKLALVARSSSAALTATKFKIDLKTSRGVRVIAIPKHTLSRAAKVRARGSESIPLFDYVAGDFIGKLSGTHTRVPGSARATYYDVNGLVQSASDNLALQSEALATSPWVLTGTLAVTNGYASAQGYSLSRITVVSGGQLYQPITFTTNGTKTFQIVVKQDGTSAGIAQVFLYDMTASVSRGGAAITIAANGVVTASATNGSTILATTDLGSGVYRVTVSCPGIVAANTNRVYASDSAAATVSAFQASAVQAEDFATAGSYAKTLAATNGALRDAHYTSINGTRTALTERAGTNLCIQSEALDNASWTKIGTPIVTEGALAIGDLTLSLVNDDDAGLGESIYQTVAFTGDAVKAVSFFAKAGTSAKSRGALYDNTAGVNRLATEITWTAGVPSVATTVGTFLKQDTLANGVYRFSYQTTLVTAANANLVGCYPTETGAAPTGTTYFGGVQCENATFPSSYIKTTTATVTRSTDALSFSYATVPQVMTVDVKATSLQPSNFDGSFLYAIGTAAGTRLTLHKTSGAATLTGTHRSAAGTVTSVPAAVVVVGDTIEARTVLNTDGSIIQADSINGAAETVGSTSAANALDGAWAATTLYLNSDAAGANGGVNAFHSIKILAGVQSLATMQASGTGLGALVYDSGWLDVFPVVYPAGSLPVGDPRLIDGLLTAEEAVGYPMVFAHLPTTIQTARYWLIEIDDTTSAAGYVDLARLVIAGGYQPTLNASYGASLGWESETTRTTTDGGAAVYNDKPRRRVFTGALENVPRDEAFVNLNELQRKLGTSGQLFFVFDPADTAHMHRRSFLGVFKELSALAWAYGTANSQPFSIIEEL